MYLLVLVNNRSNFSQQRNDPVYLMMIQSPLNIARLPENECNKNSLLLLGKQTEKSTNYSEKPKDRFAVKIEVAEEGHVHRQQKSPIENPIEISKNLH